MNLDVSVCGLRTAFLALGEGDAGHFDEIRAEPYLAHFVDATTTRASEICVYS